MVEPFDVLGDGDFEVVDAAPAVAADAGSTYLQGAFDVDVVDATGAGDAFCGALAMGLAQGHSLPDVVRAACAAGALATTGAGAQTGLPTPAELDRLLRPEVDQ